MDRTANFRPAAGIVIGVVVVVIQQSLATCLAAESQKVETHFQGGQVQACWGGTESVVMLGCVGRAPRSPLIAYHGRVL